MDERATVWSPRFYRPGDEERILPLLQAAFDGWPKVETSVPPIDHLRWKLTSGADAIGSHIVVALGSEIVGAQLYTEHRVKLGDRILRSSQGVDFCVHPAHQGSGMRKAMFATARANLSQRFDAHCSMRSRHPAMERVRQTQHFDGLLIANRAEALARSVQQPADAPAPPAWTVRQVREFDDRIDEFWEEASRPFQLIVVRSRAYLNWRYADPRAGTFALKVAEHDARLLGYSVLRVSHKCGYIADLLVLPDRIDVAETLVADALAHFRALAVPTVECWLPIHHPYRATLLSRGFVGRKRTLPFTFHLYENQETEAAFLRRRRTAVHVAAGDTDLI